MKKIILGVSGSIAAYKAADIASKLSKKYDVHVVMTKSATKFITPITFQTLTTNPVYTEVFDENESNVSHIDLVKECDLVLIVPATANIIGKCANGIADDMLSTMFMVAKDKKKIIAPAMNTNMYENPIVQNNLKTLKSILNVIEIEPKESLLACKDYGKGALAEIVDILDVIEREI